MKISIGYILRESSKRLCGILAIICEINLYGLMAVSRHPLSSSPTSSSAAAAFRELSC